MSINTRPEISDPIFFDKPQNLMSDLANVCLVLIDIQYASADPTTGLGRWLSGLGELESHRWRWDRIRDYVVPNGVRLLDAFRAAGLGVIFVTIGAESADFSDAGTHMRDVFRRSNNYVGSPDHEILDQLKPLPSELVINKRTVSAFNSSPIDSILRARELEELYFCGVSTNGCVEGTMRDAAERGYQCRLVEDAAGSSSQELHDAGLLNIRQLCGLVISTDQVLETIGGRVKDQ
jgi:nicotinamidase-related amidase